MKDRIWALNNGFLSENVLLYGLTNANIHEYVPDFQYAQAHPLNGPCSKLIDDKFTIYYVLRDFRDYLPEYYFLILRDFIVSLETNKLNDKATSTPESVMELCQKKGAVVLKPLAGSCGIGFHKVVFDRDCFSMDGAELKDYEFAGYIAKLDKYICTEYVRQHNYAKSLFPESSNTIRFLTMRDYEVHKPFIAIAVQRIGRTCSSRMDNFSQGGLSCMIDLSSGTLGRGISYPSESTMLWYDNHPDTGQQISGVQIPYWSKVKATILKIAEYLTCVPYMGFDVIITPNSFKIIEINSLSDLNLLQVHGPLLRDERVRRFYARHIS